MSIPGKVLIALLSALAVAAAAAALDPAQSLLDLLLPTAAAALLAVLLSHRALPMPGAGAEAPAAAPPAPGPAPAPSPASRSGGASSSAPDGDRRRRDRGRRSERDERHNGKAAPPPRAGEPRTSARGGELETGTVKWFNVSKGYGFIIRANGDEIFVHHRSVRGEGRGRLDDGASVRFRVVETDKGPQAEDVEAG